MTGPIPRNSSCETVRNLVGELARAGWSSAIHWRSEWVVERGCHRLVFANLDNLRTAARQWLDSRAGALRPSRHKEVKRAPGYALGWDELIDLRSGAE